MRVVLDTNTVVNGVFFSGPPDVVLRAWRDRLIKLIVSAEILEEYRRIGELLAIQFTVIDLELFLVIMAVETDVVLAPNIGEVICDDPYDDILYSV